MATEVQETIRFRWYHVKLGLDLWLRLRGANLGDIAHNGGFVVGQVISWNDVLPGGYLTVTILRDQRPWQR